MLSLLENVQSNVAAENFHCRERLERVRALRVVPALWVLDGVDTPPETSMPQDVPNKMWVGDREGASEALNICSNLSSWWPHWSATVI